MIGAGGDWSQRGASWRPAAQADSPSSGSGPVSASVRPLLLDDRRGHTDTGSQVTQMAVDSRISDRRGNPPTHLLTPPPGYSSLPDLVKTSSSRGQACARVGGSSSLRDLKMLACLATQGAERQDHGRLRGQRRAGLRRECSRVLGRPSGVGSFLAVLPASVRSHPGCRECRHPACSLCAV